MVEVKCNCCNGTGRRQLRKHLGDTYNIAEELGEATAAQVHERLGDSIGITALNNRLNDLVAFGLLTVRKEGKQKFYRKEGKA